MYSLVFNPGSSVSSAPYNQSLIIFHIHLLKNVIESQIFNHDLNAQNCKCIFLAHTASPTHAQMSTWQPLLDVKRYFKLNI